MGCWPMKVIINYLKRVFVDGLSGMAIGLFATLIIGTIIGQIGNLVGGVVGSYIWGISVVAKAATGAGIGVGVASKLKASPLVTVSAILAGMVGSFPSIANELIRLAGSGADLATLTYSTIETLTSAKLGAPGEPLGAFIAAYVAIEIGMLVSGKTKVDIIVTPLCSIIPGALVGIFLGGPISQFMKWLGAIVSVNVEQSPILGGMLVSVIMGIFLTLPISSAAIGISMNLTGLAAGAAAVGCCCNMVGFAVASYRENKFGGLVAQGLGTSMLQMPNIVRKPIIWLPAILSSAILGPISSAVLKMTNTSIGSGMGSAGLVGQFEAFSAMSADMNPIVAIIEIVIMHFILPAVLSLAISESMRKLSWIKSGDMRLEV